MYTQEELAIRFVIKAFRKIKRYQENINAAFHSITVGYMLKDLNLSKDVIVSGFLHDIIEDTKYDYNYIKEKFNKNIADMVLFVSEDKSIKDWHVRKQKFLDKMQTANEDILIIELADKLHNLLSDYYPWEQIGNAALKNNIASYEDNKWYYLTFKNIFNQRLKNNQLLERYNEITKIYFE